MITGINESVTVTVTKDISCECNGRFNGRRCHSMVQ